MWSGVVAIKFDKYDKHGAIHWRTTSKAAAIFNAPLSSRYSSVLKRIPIASRNVLDIGCGDGFLACSIAKAFPGARVTGIDSEEQGIRFAKLKAKEKGLTNVEFSQNLSAGLPYPNGSFDVVIMTDVIEHLPDAIAMLKEIRRITQSGGVVIVTTPNRQEGAKWDHRHHYEYTGDELKRELDAVLGPTRVIGSWRMDYVRRWRRKRFGRVALDLSARLGRNAFDQEVDNPSSDYGQLTAVSQV
jgi:SAM-dependent methyltransferase